MTKHDQADEAAIYEANRILIATCTGKYPLVEAFRAGVASRNEEIKTCEFEWEQTRRENERIKGRLAVFEAHDMSARVADFQAMIHAEKLKSQKLVEALERYANRVCKFTLGGGGRVFYMNGDENPPALPFYAGEQWELGSHAEQAIAAYNANNESGNE